MFKIVRHSILIFLVLTLVWPSFSLAQETPQHEAQAPQTMDEVKGLVSKILGELPSAMKKVWEEEAWPLWKKMYEQIRPTIEPWWDKFLGLLGKEVEKKRPELEKEIKKETKEIQKDLWERFKELLK